MVLEEQTRWKLRKRQWTGTTEQLIEDLESAYGVADVAGSGVKSSRLSHDESFEVDDLDLNLNKPVNLNVSQIETQYKLFVFEEQDVGKTKEPIVAKVRTQEVFVEKSSEDVGTDDDDDDDDEDEDFMVDEENEIVKPDVDVHFDPGNDDETKNYRRRRLAELSREMEAVMNSSGQWKVNPEIPVKEYSMLRDYVVELQSIKPNTTVKIEVERNIDPSLPTRVFKRIYVCLGALKLEPVVGEDGLGGSGDGVVIGLSAATGQGVAGGLGGAGVGIRGSSHTR
nr:transposase, MuDR, MULE transposase domain protein [Tanacetum cinerariifolium]